MRTEKYDYIDGNKSLARHFRISTFDKHNNLFDIVACRACPLIAIAIWYDCNRHNANNYYVRFEVDANNTDDFKLIASWFI